MSKLELQVWSWTLALLVGLLVWLFADLELSKGINYIRNPYLINSTTGQKMEPRQLIDLGKLINLPEEYVNSTSAIERLHDLGYNTHLILVMTLDQVYSNPKELEMSGWPVANQTKCGQDLDWIVGQLNKHPDYYLAPGRLGKELTELIDSYGKPQAGLYAGVTDSLSTYSQCRRLTMDNERIKMRYCIARMRPKWWPVDEAVYPKTRIRLGMCVPEACDTLSFAPQKSTLERLIKTDMAALYRDNLVFESMFCLPDERSPLRQLPLSGRVYLLVVGSWLATVITASVLYEVLMRRRRTLIKRTIHPLAVSSSAEASEVAGSKFAPLMSINSGGLANSTIQISASAKLQDGTAKPRSFKFQLLETLSIHHTIKKFKSNAFLAQQGANDLKHGANTGEGEIKIRPRVNLLSLHSIKFLMAIMIIFGHSGYLSSTYARSLSNKIAESSGMTGWIGLSLGRCVDTFFVLFGMLSSYTCMRKYSAQQLAHPLTWIKINFFIQLRIAPIFMLTFWFSRSVSPYLSEGPWWDYGVCSRSQKGNCMSKPWYSSIPYFGNSGEPPFPSCVLPAWFLISYSQLALVIPLLTYLIWKLPHRMRLFIVALAASASGLQFVVKILRQTSFKEEALSMYGSLLVNVLEKFDSLGTISTIGRVGCVTIGCYVGYLLRMYEVGEIRAWPKWLTSRITLFVCVALHFVIVLMPALGFIVQQKTHHQASLNEFIGSYLVLMLLWPVVNSIVFINSVSVYQRTAIVRFFSHSFWHSANKLGFVIYLVHWEVLYLGLTGFNQEPPMYFISDVFKLWASGVVYTLVVAFLLYIFIDGPLLALTRLAMQHSARPRRSSLSDVGRDEKSFMENNTNSRIKEREADEK